MNREFWPEPIETRCCTAVAVLQEHGQEAIVGLADLLTGPAQGGDTRPHHALHALAVSVGGQDTDLRRTVSQALALTLQKRSSHRGQSVPDSTTAGGRRHGSGQRAGAVPVRSRTVPSGHAGPAGHWGGVRRAIAASSASGTGCVSTDRCASTGRTARHSVYDGTRSVC